MPIPNFPSLSFLQFLSISLLFSPQILSNSFPALPCNSTQYPNLCRSILSTFQSPPSNPYSYTKFSITQCLKQAQIISNFISGDFPASLRRPELNALDDCKELSETNVEYLEAILIELNSPEFESDSAGSLSQETVEKIKTLLSALVTNLDTCHDGLVEAESGLAAVLEEPLANATRFYSVAQDLMTQATARNLKRAKRPIDEFLTDTNPLREPLSGLFEELQTGFNEKSRDQPLGEEILEKLGRNQIKVLENVRVSQSGMDNFTSIGDAIEFAPNKSKNEDGFFVIYIKSGIYEEYVNIAKYKHNIMMIGDGINQTVITGNHCFGNWTTFKSSTFAVNGERFAAIGITFKNTAGPEKHQAVAVRNSADCSTFYQCSFEGYQDTLYVHKNRQFYRECNIYGTIDFIFGNAAAIFQNCNLYARKPLPSQKIAFTAQSRTDQSNVTGISIINCTIEAAPDLAMELNFSTSYLGRPWRNYSRTVIMKSYIGELIHPLGWLEWNGSYGLDTLFYGEYENYGPGANVSGRVNWPGFYVMNISQALNFTVYNFTMGDVWLPYTDVPFSEGL